MNIYREHGVYQIPRDMYVLFFFEGPAGLVAWGAALGPVFEWLA